MKNSLCSLLLLFTLPTGSAFAAVTAPAPTASSPKAAFVCSAICGHASSQDESMQGLIALQVVATGATANEAFSKLKVNCQALSSQVQKISQPDGHTPPVLQLLLGFTANVTEDGLKGGQLPASANNVCTAL